MADPVGDGGSTLTTLGGYVAAIVGGLATAFGGYRYARASTSKDAVAEASNEANISAIDTYKELVATERAARKVAEDRADSFAKEYNAAQKELYTALGKLEAMQDQLAAVSKELEDLRAEVAKLRQGQPQ